MKTKELSVNLNFDSDRFQKLISDFINNDLQIVINEKLKQFVSQCIEVEQRSSTWGLRIRQLLRLLVDRG